MTTKIIIVVSKVLRIFVNLFSAKDKEGDNKLLIGIIGGFIFFILTVMTPIATVTHVGLLIKDKIVSGVTKVATLGIRMFVDTITEFRFDEDITETQLYADCVNVYNRVKDEYYSKLELIASEIDLAPIGYSEATGEMIYPKVFVSLDFSSVDIDYLLAFINTKYVDCYTVEFKFDEDEAYNFLQNIIVYFPTTITDGTDCVYVVGKVMTMNHKSIAINFFDDKDDADMYIFCYNSLKENTRGYF
jgi:hypothetical protein